MHSFGVGASSVLICGLSYTTFLFFFFQAEDGIRDVAVTGVQTCALPISRSSERTRGHGGRGRRRLGPRDPAALARRNRRPGARVRSDDRAAPPIPRAAGPVRETGLDRTDGGGGGPRAAEPAGKPARGGAARPAPRRGTRRPRTVAGHRRAGRSARSADRSPVGILPAHSVPPAPGERAVAGRGRARRLLRAAAPARGRAGDELSGGAPRDSSRSDALGAGADRDRV